MCRVSLLFLFCIYVLNSWIELPIFINIYILGIQGRFQKFFLVGSLLLDDQIL
ncbi:hypothetical protein HanRHA438_Chr10g0435371 [Helianthus annuus]|nr:hypothetical protein HanRHA438_Chr10g0435371 [Helianthus annuus]